MFEEKTVKLPVCYFPLQFNHQTLNFTAQLYYPYSQPLVLSNPDKKQK